MNLKREITRPLNFEMAATDEMVAMALRIVPHACCLVPEKRAERTTEGGLDVVGHQGELAPRIRRLKDAGIRVSLFIEPDERAIDASARLGADIVELHTGTYCERALANDAVAMAQEVRRIADGARHAAVTGLEVHAGHGLTFATVGQVARMPEMRELNIGHFLVGEGVFMGLAGAIGHMRRLMDEARDGAGS